MISVIGLASGIGGNLLGCREAPFFLKKNLKLSLNWETLLYSDCYLQNNLEEIALLNTKLAEESFTLAQKRNFFISLGGDHSCAIGTWSGVSESYRSEGDLGLIWIDAHMDAHTFETSESGNIHGMPLAVLLGYGSSLLTTILGAYPKIKPENLILIGSRSYEEGEFRLLRDLNVKIYFMEEVLSRGLRVILEEALAYINPRTVGYGMSFDLDSIDPAFVQGVGTPVPNGIDKTETLQSLEWLFSFQPPVAFELVEYNPLLDESLETFKVVEQILSIAVSASVAL